jgi:hypothetical protein
MSTEVKIIDGPEMLCSSDTAADGMTFSFAKTARTLKRKFLAWRATQVQLIFACTLLEGRQTTTCANVSMPIFHHSPSARRPRLSPSFSPSILSQLCTSDND